MASILLFFHVLLDLIHRDMARTFDDDLHKLVPGNLVGNAHDRQTVHTRVHHLRVCGKEAQERPSKQQQSQTQKQSRTEGVSRADQEGPADTVLLACAVVLAD